MNYPQALKVGDKYYPLKGDTNDVQKVLKNIPLPDAFILLHEEISSNVKFITRIFCSKRTRVRHTKKELLESITFQADPKFWYKEKGSMNILLYIILNIILPRAFYGTVRNKRCLERIIKLMFTRSMHECIYTASLCSGIDVDKVTWLDFVDESKRRASLELGIRRVLNESVLPLFQKLYHPLHNTKSYEIEFVPKNLWQSYISQVSNEMLKRKYMVIEKPTIQNKQYVLGSLTVAPKTGLDDVKHFRAYTRVGRNPKTIKAKKDINRILYRVARKLCPFTNTSIYKHWKEFSYNTRGKQLYGIKLDVADCFGNVDTEKLIEIIKLEQNIPLSCKRTLLQKIRNQYVYFGKGHSGKTRKLYKWQHGLLQGAQLSAGLCELYMSYFDRKHLNTFMNCGFLHRKVDDYFFCSVNAADVINFKNTVGSYMKLQEDKTQTNVDEDTYNIGYCGYEINLNTREIKTLYKFKKYTQLRHKFKIWNPRIVQSQPRSLLLRAMHYPYNNYKFSKILLNTDYNSRRTMLENYFASMVYLAFKFDCAVMGAFKNKLNDEDASILQAVITKTVFKYSNKALKTVGGTKVKVNYLIKAGFNAFKFVLKKRQNPVYKEVIQWIDKVQSRNKIPEFHLYNVNKLPEVFNNISMKRILGKL